MLFKLPYHSSCFLPIGILPPHECNHEYVWSQRTQQYHDLESALKVMQIINDRTLQSVVFLHMFNLEHGEIPFSLHETVSILYIYIYSTKKNCFFHDSSSFQNKTKCYQLSGYR